MPGDLRSVRQKFDRAKTHLDALDAEIERADKSTNLYGLLCEPDVESGYYLVKAIKRCDDSS
jgi:hypothetical protein